MQLRIMSLIAVTASATYGCAAGIAPHYSQQALSSSPVPHIASTESIVEASAYFSHIRQNALANASVQCPANMALIDDRVCIDRWEATLVDRSGNPWSPFLPIDEHEDTFRAVSVSNVVPQGYISGSQAQRACLASGKRLCNASEWELACKGPRHTTFPYGDHRQAHVCNDDIRTVHPVAEVGALLNFASEDLWTTAMNNPLLNQLPNGLLRTGERTECTNEYGVYDLVGNLHEWIDDPSGTFRGGYYMDTALNGEGCNYQTTAHRFDYHDYSTGFRCCMDPVNIE